MKPPEGHAFTPAPSALRCTASVRESDPGSNTEPPRILGRCALPNRHGGEHSITPAPPAKGEAKCGCGPYTSCEAHAGDGQEFEFKPPDPKPAEAAMSEAMFDAFGARRARKRALADFETDELYAEARRARVEEKRLREQIETILNDPGYNAIRQSDQALRGALEEIVDTVRSKVDVYARIVQIRNLAAAALRGVKK